MHIPLAGQHLSGPTPAVVQYPDLTRVLFVTSSLRYSPQQFLVLVIDESQLVCVAEVWHAQPIVPSQSVHPVLHAHEPEEHTHEHASSLPHVPPLQQHVWPLE
jgi:hypothetical protein